MDQQSYKQTSMSPLYKNILWRDGPTTIGFTVNDVTFAKEKRFKWNSIYPQNYEECYRKRRKSTLIQRVADRISKSIDQKQKNQKRFSKRKHGNSLDCKCSIFFTQGIPIFTKQNNSTEETVSPSLKSPLAFYQINRRPKNFEFALQNEQQRVKSHRFLNHDEIGQNERVKYHDSLDQSRYKNKKPASFQYKLVDYKLPNIHAPRSLF